MRQRTTVQFNFDSFNLISLVVKYWKILLVTGVFVFIISAAISLKITPHYRSTVVLYPTTNVVEAQSLLGVLGTVSELFGDETATEKVLQILRSDKIKNFLVEKYNLFSHYGISDKVKFKYTMLDKRMKKNIASRKTQFNSVEISVLDPDPLLAAAMANDIARQIDTVFNQIVKGAGRKTLVALNNTYKNQYQRIKLLEDSLRLLKSAGDLSIRSGRMKAGISNSSWTTSAGLSSPEFLRLMNLFESENENLSKIQGKLTEAKMLAEQDLPYVHIINKANVAEKKAIPKRSMIVVTTTFSALLLMIFFLGLADSFVKNDK